MQEQWEGTTVKKNVRVYNEGILVGPQGDTNLRLAFRVMAKPGLRSKMHWGWMEKEWAGSTRKTLIKQMKRCKFRKSDA